MKKVVQGVVALLLLWLVVRNLDVKAFADTLGRLRISSILAACTLFFLSCALAASKWRLLWRGATWTQMLNANFAAQFYSLILPGQLAGEVVKILRVGHRFSDTTNVAASVLVDRAAGLVGLLILAFGGALLSRSAVAADATLVLFVAVFGFVGILFAVTVAGIFRAASAVLGHLGDRYASLRPASRKIIEFLSAWASLMSAPRTILSAIALGIAFQAISVCINIIIASDLGITVDFADWCWIFGLVSIASLLPITKARMPACWHCLVLRLNKLSPFRSSCSGLRC
jgi:uncharacterized membrane protein YbhN (UPF0104 family)